MMSTGGGATGGGAVDLDAAAALAPAVALPLGLALALGARGLIPRGDGGAAPAGTHAATRWRARGGRAPGVGGAAAKRHAPSPRRHTLKRCRLLIAAGRGHGSRGAWHRGRGRRVSLPSAFHISQSHTSKPARGLHAAPGAREALCT